MCEVGGEGCRLDLFPRVLIPDLQNYALNDDLTEVPSTLLGWTLQYPQMSVGSTLRGP